MINEYKNTILLRPRGNYISVESQRIWLIYSFRWFGGASCPHIQSIWFFVDYYGDGSSELLRKVSNFKLIYAAPHIRRIKSSLNRFENLKYFRIRLTMLPKGQTPSLPALDWITFDFTCACDAAGILHKRNAVPNKWHSIQIAWSPFSFRVSSLSVIYKLQNPLEINCWFFRHF